MTGTAAGEQSSSPDARGNRRVVVCALGVAQIVAWGTSFYFPAVFAPPIVAETGWPLEWVVGGTSLGLLIAGLIAPKVGAIIQTHGGRSVLLASSLFYAAGLATVGLAPSLAVFLAGWLLIGIGMGAGLYDAVFAALGRMYGSDARSAIASLTLFGGFSSTICWPLSAFMIDHFGWRTACFVYAAVHLALSAPLQMLAMRGGKSRPLQTSGAAGAEDVTPAHNERGLLALLAVVLSLAAGIGSILIVHLLIILQAKGVAPAAAVALGTLFGPAQVGARVFERLFGSRYHPFWTMLGACTLMAAGLALLVGGGVGSVALAILVYGAGYGVTWIGRGTLPLALFGPARFPRLMGKLAFPSLIVQALAPSAGALLIDAAGAISTLIVLFAMACVNVLTIGLIWPFCRTKPVSV